MTSHHIIYDITCTVFMTSLPLYLKWHPLYLCHHNDSIGGLRPTVCMTSHPPYLCHLLHCTQCHIHSLWLHKIVVTHNLHCIHDIIHPIYDITHMTIQTLYLPSDPLYLTLHPLYLCCQTQGMKYTTPTLCITSHTLYVWHYIQYACYHNNCFWHYTPLYITSHPVYLRHHIQYVRYHHTDFMTTQQVYRTSHAPHLTSQPLNLCHHIDGTHICIDVLLHGWHHNMCVNHDTWHTYDIIPNLHHITFTLYAINDHVLWHHKHCIHDIRSPLYNITSTL